MTNIKYILANFSFYYKSILWFQGLLKQQFISGDMYTKKKQCKNEIQNKIQFKMYDTKSLKCSLRHSMHLYAQVWLVCQAARIKKHPGKGEWLLVQKFGSSVFSYTTSFVFMSSWWMQCNLTLIVSKSSWKVCNRITIYLFFQPTTWQHDKSQGYHQWSVTSDNNSMWAKEGFLYFSKKKKKSKYIPKL